MAQENIAQPIMVPSIEGHAIAFALYDGDDQAALHIDHHASRRYLTAEVRNVSARDIQFLPIDGAGTPGPDAYHFALRFRRQVLEERRLSQIAADLPAGWQASALVTEREDVTVYFLANPSQTALLRGQTLAFELSGITASAALGARSTRVQLLYDQLQYVTDDDVMRGTRLSIVQILNNLGRRSAPLEPIFMARDTLINDGVKRSIAFKLSNVSGGPVSFSTDADQPTRFTFSLRIPVDPFPESVDPWKDKEVYGLTLLDGDQTFHHPEENGLQWVFTNKKMEGVAPNLSLLFTLSAETVRPARSILLEIAYENIPGFQSGVLQLPIQLSPMVFAAANNHPTARILGTSPAQGATTVNHVLLKLDDRQKSPASAPATPNYVLGISRQDSETEAMYLGNDGQQNAVLASNNGDLRLGSAFKTNFTEHMRVRHDGNVTIEKDLQIKGKIDADLTVEKKLVVKDKIEGMGAFVKGMIIMWSGMQHDIPEGWALCNGQNGTPELRGKFILGAAGMYGEGSKGGNAYITLKKEQLPAHDHDGSVVSIQERGTQVDRNAFMTNSSSPQLRFPKSYWNHMQQYRHGPFTDTPLKIAEEGKGKAIHIMPPYYALCYIMYTGKKKT